MTDTAQKTIAEAMEATIREATLSGAGLTAFNALRDRAADQDKQLASLKHQLAQAERKERELHAANQRQADQITQFTTQLDGYKKRESVMTANETAKAVAEARATTAIEMFHAVFRPSAVRETIQTQIAMPPPVQGPHGVMTYPTTMPVTNTNTITKE
jgi:chromosome segregation ATPase